MKIDKNQIEDLFPMSDISFGMVYHALQKPQEAMYHDQIVFNVPVHDFDSDTFRKALQLIVGKHENLRSNYNLYDFDQPIQFVFKNIEVDYVHEDISDLTEAQQESHITGRMTEDKADIFSIGTQTPLWRIKTFLLSNDNLFVIWVNHHAIVDGWSTSLVMKELHETYFSLIKGISVVLPKLKSSYKDYVKNQLVLKKQQSTSTFWTKELDGVETLSLPGVYKEGDQLKNYIPQFDKAIYSSVVDATKDYSTSIKHICFAAYAYAIYMITHQTDLLMGIITHTRPVVEDGDKIVGCFLNTVPFRLQVESGLTWEKYMRLVDSKLIELKKHEGLSLKEINKVIGYNQSDSLINTFFNYMDFYMYKNIEDDEDRLNKDYMSSSVHVSSYEKTDTYLDFMLDVGAEKLNLVIRYYESVIPTSLAESLGAYFYEALKNITSNPEGVCGKDQIISQSEKETILNAFNDTTKTYKEWTIVDAFRNNVANTPNAPALFFEGTCMTYVELDKKSDQIADYLINEGLEIGDVVALCMERSFELIIGIYGIWKARGVYLPIDVNYPIERVKFTIEDSGATFLLTKTNSGNQTHLCKIVEVESVLQNHTSRNSVLETDVDDTAYIIYTSGSTGKPKGVVVNHRSLTNRISWMQNDYPISDKDKIMQKTSISFDVSLWELCWWSVVSAPLFLLEQNEEKDPQAIFSSIGKAQISVMHFVPSMLDAFLEYVSNIDNKENLNSLRLVFSSGEALKPSSVVRFKELLPNCKLVNLYGPTEACIDVTAYDCNDYVEGIIPIGKPIDNTSIYILNKNMEIQPIGVTGDLYIGGVGLATEYINRPELTKDKFVEYGHDKVRLYQSGDLARWVADGNIEYLGREDDQVKIRGFRIELGEVEKILLQHPNIREAVVICSSEQNGNRLSAYLLADNELGLKGIQDFMFGIAPAYMIPGDLFILDNMPVKSNGKVDRKKLPELAKRVSSGEVFKLPENDIENRIAEIWKKVLGKENVSVNDNFFQLGGDSIRILKVFNELNTVFEKQVNVVDLFKYTTISTLAEYYTTKVHEEVEEDYEESFNMLLDSTNGFELDID